MRPSRASKPSENDQFAQVTVSPSTVKLGPSGWVMEIGFRVSSGAGRSDSRWKLPGSSGTGSSNASTTWVTSCAITST